MYDRHLRVLAWMLALVAVICVILAFRTNIILGYISMVFMLIMTVVAYITLKQVTEDTTEYISDLSYRIKRGEQDALIKNADRDLILRQRRVYRMDQPLYATLF